MARSSLLPLLLAALLSSCSSSDDGAHVPLPEGVDGHRWDFEDVSTGALPFGWRVEATNPGQAAAEWRTVDDPAGKLLALVDPRGATGQTYSLCWTDELGFRDGVVEVSVRAGTGVEDQGGGPAWRIRDADNYYLARWNPLENNFRVYSVTDGERRQLDSAEVDVAAGAWHTIAIEHAGTRIRCWLGGTLLLEVTDETHPDAGGVGLWTKADAATAFDDLRVFPASG